MPTRALILNPNGDNGLPVWPPNTGSLGLPATVTIGDSANDGTITIYKGATEYTAAIAVPGIVSAFAGSTAPNLWLLCYGQAISRTTYAALFAVVGTTYGTGDGSTTFNIPDLRGRVVAGQDDMGGTSANRLTGSVTGSVDGDVLGGTGGEEGHTLTANTDAGGTGEQGSASLNNGTEIVDGGPAGSWASDTIQINAAATAHNTVQPTIILNYIIYTGV